MGVGGRLDGGRQAVVSSTPTARIVNRFHARDLHLVTGPRAERSVRLIYEAVQVADIEVRMRMYLCRRWTLS
jgi:hypothetical protein